MLLCVYVGDYRDAHKVGSVGMALCELLRRVDPGLLRTPGGRARSFHFKPDVFTLEGRYQSQHASCAGNTRTIGNTAIYRLTPADPSKRAPGKLTVVEPDTKQPEHRRFWSRPMNAGAPRDGDGRRLAAKDTILFPPDAFEATAASAQRGRRCHLTPIRRG